VWLNVAPYSASRTGCQDVIGSNPSVFLDKNKFLKELAANVRYKFLNFQTFFNKKIRPKKIFMLDKDLKRFKSKY